MQQLSFLRNKNESSFLNRTAKVLLILITHTRMAKMPILHGVLFNLREHLLFPNNKNNNRKSSGIHYALGLIWYRVATSHPSLDVGLNQAFAHFFRGVVSGILSSFKLLFFLVAYLSYFLRKLVLVRQWIWGGLGILT